MLNRPPLRRTLVCLALLLTGSLSASSARAIPDDPAGSVRFCVHKDSRLVRLVAANESCRLTESLVVVAIQGPPGPAGPGLETGSIVGRMTTDCWGTPNTDVFVLGHSFSARVDSAGQFKLHWVPAGNYLLSAPYAYPFPVEWPALVAAGAITDLGDIKLQSVLTDPMNCGACGRSCIGGETCQQGTCACPADNPVRCEPTPWRPYALCMPAGSVCPACPWGQMQCDGVCVDTMNDPRNCGTCGNSCGLYMCMAGTCLMPPPPEQCPGMVLCPNGTCAMTPEQCPVPEP